MSILTIYKRIFICINLMYTCVCRRAVTIHPPVYGITYGFSQGLLFFMFAVVFRFGAFLINLPQDHLVHEPFEDVFRVFFAIIFGAFAIGQASAFAPNYSKAKLSANRIFFLLDRQPVIDNYSEDGEKLVSSNFFCAVWLVSQ